MNLKTLPEGFKANIQKPNILMFLGKIESHSGKKASCQFSFTTKEILTLNQKKKKETQNLVIYLSPSSVL